MRSSGASLWLPSIGDRVDDKTEQSSKIPARTVEPPLRVEIRVRESGSPDVVPNQAGVTVFRENALRYMVLCAVLVIAGLYAGLHFGRGWVPADDGILAQSALRVLQGQLPHRDFAEIYTGGLSLVHAVAFRLFGVNLMSLRICVFLFFLSWIPAVYWIATRFTSALAAGVVTLVAVAWSYPNYPAAMPSWYNLFFATFGAAALLRYLDVRTRKWLYIAGVCGGLSILIKIIGAYYIAGALLFFPLLEQSDIHGTENSGNHWPYRVFSASALLLFLATIVLLLRTRLGLSEYYEFVLPSTIVVGLVLLREKSVRIGSARRFKSLLRLLIPFLCGVLTPVTTFLVPSALSGSMVRFFSGVFSSAMARSVGLSVIRPIGPLHALLYGLPLLGLLAAGMYWDKFQSIAVGAALGIGAIAIVFRSTQAIEVASGVWCSAATLTPLAVIFGAAIVLLGKDRSQHAELGRQQIALLISLAATCTLVQYPFAAPIYLSYALPLTLLSLVAITSTGKTQRGTFVLAPVLGFYLLFGVVILVPHYIYELTHVVGKMDEMHAARAGGLKIEGGWFFDDLGPFLRAHSPNGKMYAGNDCPELYFLSGLQNVTSNDGGADDSEVLNALQSDDLKLFVINESPYFPSARMSAQVRAAVERNFPESRMFGIFHVFWRQ